MSERRAVENRAGSVLRVMLACVLALAAATLGSGTSLSWQGSDDAEAAHIRVIHGLSTAGPLDIYIDGAIALIGIVFGETSGPLILAPGEHQFAVTPTGAQPDDALVSGTIALRAGASVYAPLIGSADAASVGLFTIDERPLEQGRARFRVTNGVPDTNGVLLAFTGGDALTPTLGFGEASEYAVTDAGSYDIDILDATSGAILLSLPATPFAEGMTTDIQLVGQVVDGSLAAIVEGAPVEVTRPVGLIAQLVEGACVDAGPVVTDLGLVRTGQGAAVGVSGVALVAQGYALASVPFALLVDSPHSVKVTEGEGTAGEIVACGEIGGQLTDTGALVVALHETGGSASGIAVLAPGFEAPETTGVSVFLTTGDILGEALPGATPTAVDG